MNDLYALYSLADFQSIQVNVYGSICNQDVQNGDQVAKAGIRIVLDAIRRLCGFWFVRFLGIQERRFEFGLCI